MSFHRHSAPSEGSASRHSTISVGGTRSRSRRGPATVHAASLLSLQLWAISELRNVLPPLGDGVRVARLLFLGVVAALAVALWLCHLLVAFARWVGFGGIKCCVYGYAPLCRYMIPGTIQASCRCPAHIISNVAASMFSTGAHHHSHGEHCCHTFDVSVVHPKL